MKEGYGPHKRQFTTGQLRLMISGALLIFALGWDGQSMMPRIADQFRLYSFPSPFLWTLRTSGALFIALKSRPVAGPAGSGF